jgi:hypothetical protein
MRKHPIGEAVALKMLAALASGAVLAGLLIVSPGHASVGTCPTDLHYDFVTDYWSHAAGVAGFRAPIELRKNGDVCSPPSGGFQGNVYEWVGLQASVGSGGISQIGWTDDYTNGYCRFLYWDNSHGSNSGVIEDRCGSDTVGTVRLFKVEDTNVSGTHRYSIFDCGTSDWQNCTRLDDGPTVANLQSEFGLAAAESPFGTGCTQVIMGSQGSPTVYGGSLGDIKEIQDFGDSYTVHSLTYGAAQCNHYDSGIHNDQKLTTYDDRN